VGWEGLAVWHFEISHVWHLLLTNKQIKHPVCMCVFCVAQTTSESMTDIKLLLNMSWATFACKIVVNFTQILFVIAYKIAVTFTTIFHTILREISVKFTRFLYENRVKFTTILPAISCEKRVKFTQFFLPKSCKLYATHKHNNTSSLLTQIIKTNRRSLTAEVTWQIHAGTNKVWLL